MIFCVSFQVSGTAESARSCVRAYFADLHETLCRQEEMALSVVDAHVRERLIWLRQQQEDMTILLSQVSTACLHCEKTLQQVSSTAAPERREKKQSDATSLFLCFQDDCRVVLAKQEINCLLETLQKQQHQFTELADHIQLDAGIPVTFTKVHTPGSWIYCCPQVKLPHLIHIVMVVFRTTGCTSVQRWRSGW